ncbi:ferredoxin [Nocardia barduliensis]|uniref:ferredoxin n=1 Tax=Nocardia barduliensis TaxID=2736643 RepID=UPI0015727779|nr:ferredoxin [Nocardia barduliensis]
MRIRADLDLCQGHAVCQAEAPEVFTVPKRGRVEILDDAPTGEHEPAVANAIRYCPTQALSIADAGATDPSPKGTD